MKALAPVEKIYHLLVGAKNFFYDRYFLKTIKLKIPVVSVGNLSFGGVGKTPCIILLARELSLEYKVTIVTKSYKASLREPGMVNLNTAHAAETFGDEACLIQQKLPNCTVWSGPNKASSAAASIITQPNIILLDDGFSHRKLYRNFDLVLIDATQGFDNYQRESINSLKRAHAVLITKTNLSNKKAISEIERKILSVSPQLKESLFQSGVKTELKLKKTDPLFVFCGLGRPQTFIKDLEQQGYRVIHKKYYADHFFYSVVEQKKIAEEYLDLQLKYKNLKLVTTEKDFIKISENSLKENLFVPEHSIDLDSVQKEVLIEKIRQSL